MQAIKEEGSGLVNMSNVCTVAFSLISFKELNGGFLVKTKPLGNKSHTAKKLSFFKVRHLCRILHLLNCIYEQHPSEKKIATHPRPEPNTLFHCCNGLLCSWCLLVASSGVDNHTPDCHTWAMPWWSVHVCSRNQHAMSECSASKSPVIASSAENPTAVPKVKAEFPQNGGCQRQAAKLAS